MVSLINKKTLVPLFLLLLAPLVLGNVNYTEQYCQDNDTLVIEHYYDNGTENITTAKEYKKPYYGCEEGSVVQPADHMKYGLVTAVALGFFILVNLLVIFALPKGKHGAIKFGLIFLVLVSLFYFLMTIGSVGAGYQHLENTSELLFGLSNGFFWFAFLVIAYFLVILIKNIMMSFTKKGEPDDYSGWR